MATDCDGCLWTRSEVNPVQVEKYPASVSFFHVERAGDPSEACKKEMRWVVQGLVEVLRGTAGSV